MHTDSSSAIERIVAQLCAPAAIQRLARIESIGLIQRCWQAMNRGQKIWTATLSP
jgi:hypothetical protein